MHSRALVVILIAGLLILGSVPLVHADYSPSPGPASAGETQTATSSLVFGTSSAASGASGASAAAASAASADVWKALPAAEDCDGPVDGAGRAWFDPKLDDSAWPAVQLPEFGTIPGGQDRYYRLHFRLSTASSVEMLLSADDSAWLYVNGQRVGAWGAAECHGDGAAGEVRVDLTAYVRKGDNVVAVHVSNGPGESLFQAALSSRSMAPSKIVPFMDLPYDYGRSSFAIESASIDHGGRVTAYFDHEYPGSCRADGGGGCAPSDTRAVHFFGYEGGISGRDGARYNVYYNGHSGTDFALAAGRPVLAAAAGIVTFAGEVSSVCSDGQTRAARVVRVLHPNGYTSEYWHLSSFASGIEVGSWVTRDPQAPIGYVGATGCTTGPHLHFAVLNPSRVPVDPYAWNPRPDTPWYGQNDPWRSFGGPSHYLWVHSLLADADTQQLSPTLVYAASATARVDLPANAAAIPLRVEMAEGLPSVYIPDHLSLYMFSAVAYTTEGQPQLALDAEAYVEVRVPASQLRVISESKGAPALLRWEPDTGRWESLPTTWDRETRVASARTGKLGTFALTMQAYSYFIPVVSKSGAGGETVDLPGMVAPGP